MKYISVILLSVTAAALVACSGSSSRYSVTGSNAPQEGAAVYLVDKLSNTAIDSTHVADGSFTLQGKAAKDALLSLRIDGADWYFPLFNDGEPVQIDVADTTTIGSALNTKLTECDRKNGEFMGRFNNFVRAFMALPRAEQEARETEFMVQYQNMVEEIGESYVKMIEDNLDNIIPVAFIEDVPVLAGDDKFLELVSLDVPFAKHPYTQEVKRRFDEEHAQEVEANNAKESIVGQKFLDLEEADPDGNLHKLSEYVGQGNWALVDFWASWCGPCKAEMPNVVEAYKKYHSKGFQIVGLSFDKEKEPWVEAISEWEMPWIHLSDLKYWKTVASEVYSVNAIPDNLLIDPEGTVVARGLRGKKLAEKLKEIYE